MQRLDVHFQQTSLAVDWSEGSPTGMQVALRGPAAETKHADCRKQNQEGR